MNKKMQKSSINVNKHKIDVKIHQIKLKTSMRLFKSFKQLLFKSPEIHLNSLNTYRD